MESDTKALMEKLEKQGIITPLKKIMRMLLGHIGCSRSDINAALLRAVQHFPKDYPKGYYNVDFVQIISLLLQAGADVNCLGKDGHSSWFHLLNNVMFQLPEWSANSRSGLPYQHSELPKMKLTAIKLFLKSGARTESKIETMPYFQMKASCPKSALEICLVDNVQSMLKTCGKFSLSNLRNIYLPGVSLSFELLCQVVELILANGINLENENTVTSQLQTSYSQDKGVLDQFITTLEQNSSGMRNLYYCDPDMWKKVLAYQSRIVRSCLLHGIEIRQKMGLVCLLTVSRSVGEHILYTILDTMTPENNRRYLRSLTQNDYRKDTQWCNLKDICDEYLERMHVQALQEICRVVIMNSAVPQPEGLLRLNIPAKIKSYLFFGHIPESLD